jgi:hypothetical protein
MTDNNRQHIKPLHVIFCDDIRREDNGKELLIGVYSGNLVISHLPAHLVLSVWVSFEKPETWEGKIPIEFRLLDVSTSRALGYGTFEMEMNSKQTARTGSMALRGLSVMLNHGGDYAFQLKQYDEPWAIVGNITVEVGPTITKIASAPEQPS